jgi:alkyldihydroxyacetonephosphate synthase
VIPFGGGVEPHRDAARYKGALTIDLRELGRVLEVDKTSRAARIEAGAFGPALESQLKPHGLTLRHFPLGGWIATRSGGHFATLYTHIDDLVESLRVITRKVCSRRGGSPARAPARALIGC